jgi:polyphenol oxidase
MTSGSEPVPTPPRLERLLVGGIAVWWDPQASGQGVLVAFSERGGGVSSSPYASLNLAAHVGDEPSKVDANRDRLLGALGLAGMRDRLTSAEQVHGDRVEVVSASAVGAGGWAARGVAPVPGADALVTAEHDVPLMLCFADCVPVVLAAPGRAVGVAHAGWRGALAGIPGSAVRVLADIASCDPREMVAYIGPHIGSCHYEVGDEIMSHFCNTFGTFARADSGGLDLGAVVTASLVDAGVAPCSIARLATCTAEATDRFFSHRAERGRTGRHAALACMLSDAPLPRV